MSSSQNKKSDIIFAIYRDHRTVFRLNDVAMLTGESNFHPLNKKLNYYVRSGKLLNPRKGIYAKPDYKPEELACSVFKPSYISLEYILQEAGVIFQYDPKITVVSYLSRNLTIEDQLYLFRKIKSNMLVNTAGINLLDNHISKATTERAFLDLLYLDKEYYFDNLRPLNSEFVYKLLPVYQSRSLIAKATNLLKK